ncbi:MAG: hypothetical protein ACLFVF_04110, partial [Thiohalospira sp.]
MQTLSRRLDMTLAAVILIGCTAVIQYHAIQFWTAQVDPVTGWAWSLLLEAVALWLWWRRGIIRALALLASLLVMAGPVYHVSAPLVEELHQGAHADDTREARLDALDQRIEAQKAALERFLENSENRAGWLPAIEDARAELADARQAKAELMSEAENAGMAWREQAIIVMQAVALMLFQVVGVLAVTRLSQLRGGDAHPRTAPGADAPAATTTPAG